MFYDRFKQLAQKKGLSVNAAVAEIGMSNSASTKWKKYGAVPESKNLEKIAAYFDVTTDYLLGKAQKENAPAKSEDVLTEDEKEFIELVRLLSSEDRAKVIERARTLAEINSLQKK